MPKPQAYCPFCRNHYDGDDGHQCWEGRSGTVTKFVAHDAAKCLKCKGALDLSDAKATMARFDIPGKARVEIGWIGEGSDGDYREDDPEDAPLLRFDAYDLARHPDPRGVPDGSPSLPELECTGFGGCCRGAQDASYCTQLWANLPKEVLASVCRHIAEAIADTTHWKRVLERLSWLTNDDAEKIHKGYQEARV